MHDQLELLNKQRNISWFTKLKDHFNLTESSGWPDKLSNNLREWSSKKKIKINTLSLFSGGGGLDIGFHDVGFNIVEMVEIEKDYVKTLDKNSATWFNNSKANCIDIRLYNPPNSEIDFVIGGPPCQTFSAAGRRAKGVMGMDDPRGNLFKEYVRLLKLKTPKAFLFENVYGLLGAQKGKPWKLIVEGFQEAGYKVFYKLVDAADYGVPQHRERVFIVGIRNDLNIDFKFPYPTHGLDSEEKTDHYSAGLAVKTAPKEKPKMVNGKYGYLLNEIPPGLNYSFYTKKMGHPQPVFGWRSKFSDFLYKADPDKPVRAIKAQGGQYTGPFSWNNRFFNVSELKRLQTFPDDYELVGSRNISVQQIGNSVPPQLARIMALAVLDQVFKVELPFKINYMPNNYQLGFRTRKRELTKEYEKKAKLAIQSMMRTSDLNANSKYIKNQEYLRYLALEKMKWNSNKISNSTEYKVKHISENGVWSIHIKSKGTNSIKPRLVISVEPKNVWDLPYSKVEMISYTDKLESFTAMWKAFEEKMSEVYGYADLVQLFGYYQYESNIKAKVVVDEVNDLNVKSLLKLILSNEITNKSITLEEVASAVDTAIDNILNGLIKLKQLGYEIRSNITNPQISEGNYIIPYIYPTLTDRSVQLSKKLV